MKYTTRMKDITIYRDDYIKSDEFNYILDQIGIPEKNWENINEITFLAITNVETEE